MKFRSGCSALLFALALSACGGERASEPAPVTRQAKMAALEQGSPLLLFSGNRSAYTIASSGSGFIVTAAASGAATSVNSGAHLQFSDVNVALDTNGNVAKAYRIYRAALDRVPDAGGLTYWIGLLDANASLETIASGFINSSEFGARFGANLSNEAILTAFYTNVLHRTPDPAGYNWWLERLNGGVSREAVLASISEGPENREQVLPAIADGIAYIPANRLASTAPEAPGIASATAGDASASIAFAAPASDGGQAITSYTATCSAAGSSASATGSGSPIQVSGLVNGASYSCAVIARNAVGASTPSSGVAVTPGALATPATLTLSSSVGSHGAAMSADYTCDGTGSTIDLSWSSVPSGTQSIAVMMTTLPGDGSTKWNWVLYDIPATTTRLVKDSFGVGTLGLTSEGPNNAYYPPCSQGPGAKTYTFTVYALSAAPTFTVASNLVTGPLLTEAIAKLVLAKGSINFTSTRTDAMTGSSANCLHVRNSTLASNTGAASVSCDANYAYIGSNGIPTHAMMNGITATNLQVPLPQNFNGAKAWKIPLNPAIAATTTTATDGPVGVAINGVPIFNPCKQGGCQNGDTKVLGELDSCNGHAGRADDYHYHAAPSCVMAAKPASYWNDHPIGWALDGFAIFGYNNADGSLASRDGICGGNTSAVSNGPAGYSYHVTDASPYVLSCFRGTPSPDLAGQGAKYTTVRKPPVTPFTVSNMSLTEDASDGYKVLQFSSAIPFVTTETGTDQYNNPAGTYRIRYKAVTGAALSALLALPENSGKSVCWDFQFTTGAGAATQPSISYCR